VNFAAIFERHGRDGSDADHLGRFLRMSAAAADKSRGATSAGGPARRLAVLDHVHFGVECRAMKLAAFSSKVAECGE